MALPDLTEVLERLNLNDTVPQPLKHLPFRPSGDFSWIRDRLSSIDRYLFRISDSRSDGVTNRNRVQSRDAFKSRPTASVDIFARENHEVVVEMLNRHLRWDYHREKNDNMVSWTSSLLFALQYCWYRHVKNKSPLEHLNICVVDTKGLPEGVFTRDLDLLDAYAKYNVKLGSLRDLRTQGTYYFGEYLSQGSLQVENHCSTASIKDIIDNGLYSLQPEFEGFEMRSALWAKEVVRLRRLFHLRESQRTAIDNETVETAMKIGGLSGSHWKLAMAASFLSLRPWRNPDDVLVRLLKEEQLTDLDKMDLSPMLANVIAPASMPELAGFASALQMIHENWPTNKEVETEVQSSDGVEEVHVAQGNATTSAR